MSDLGHIDSFINSIDKADGVVGIFTVLEKAFKKLGFQHYAYELIFFPEGKYQTFYYTNYPEDWIKYYQEKRYARDDVVSRYATQKVRPFLWTEVTDSRFLTVEQQRIFNEGKEAGMKAGAVIPIYGPGSAKAYLALTNPVSEEEFQKLFLSRRHEIHLMATYAHERLLNHNIKENRFSSVALTPRELEVISWYAVGKERGEIAEILSLSETTVKTHLESVCRRLGVHNKTHAVSTALINGIITI